MLLMYGNWYVLCTSYGAKLCLCIRFHGSLCYKKVCELFCILSKPVFIAASALYFVYSVSVRLMHLFFSFYLVNKITNTWISQCMKVFHVFCSYTCTRALGKTTLSLLASENSVFRFENNASESEYLLWKV